MRRVQFSSGCFFVGDKLNFIELRSEDKRAQLVFLGVGVDASGNLVTQKRLEEKWSSSPSTAQLIKYLNACAGRFLFAISCPEFTRIYGDACGSLATYYDPKSGLIGSSQFLVLKRELIPNTEFPRYKWAAEVAGGAFAFTQTADRYTRQVLANHYLDFDTLTQTRFWPTEEDDFTCRTTTEVIESCVDFLIKRHRQIIGAISQGSSKCFLPLSGGTDSRTLLAFAQPFLKDIDCFVHIMGWTSRNDAFVARHLSDFIGFDLDIFDPIKDPSVKLSPEQRHMETLKLGLAQGLVGAAPQRRHYLPDVTCALPEGGIVMRGQVINISKGYHLTQASVNEFLETGGQSHVPKIGMKALKLKWENKAEKRYLEDRYVDWYEGLPGNSKNRAVDMALVEQHRSHSMARLFNMFTKNFYLIPSCDREMIKTMISIPPNLRYHLHIHDAIFRRSMPELMDIPYNKLFDDYLSKFRHNYTLEESLHALPDRV